jgi:hypothetical protein
VTGHVGRQHRHVAKGLESEARKCAIGCDKARVRMPLLDEKGNVLHTLMADKPFVDPNSLIHEHLKRIVTIKGDLCEASGGSRNGWRADQQALGDMRCPGWSS